MSTEAFRRMTTTCAACESVEISPRFREMIEERIARLDADAARDEARIEHLDNPEHIGRQMRLVAAERSEALRMRLFLDRVHTRTISAL
jgi:ribosome-associated translation inhibitor RaiA